MAWDNVHTVTTDSNDRKRDLDISPDGNYLAVGNRENGQVNVYDFTDPQNPQEITESPFTDSDGEHRHVRFSTDASYLTYAGEATGEIYIREVGNGWPLIETLTFANDMVRVGRFAPDMSLAAFGSNDGHCYIVDTDTWNQISVSPFDEPATDSNRQYCRGVSWTSGLEYFAYSDSAGNVYIREPNNNWNELSASPIGETNDQIRFGLEFSPDDQYIAIPTSDGAENNALHIHDVGGSWPETAVLSEASDGVKGSDWRGTWNVAHTSDDDNVYIHEVGGDWEPVQGSPLTEATDDVRSGIRFSPDGNHLAVASDDGNVYIYEFVVTVNVGNLLVTEVSVENVSDEDGEQDITMLHNGEEVDTVEGFMVQAGETDFATLRWLTETGDEGTWDITVATENDEDSIRVEVV